MTISKTAIAAIAALSLLFGTAAAPNMAVAAKGEKAFAAEKKKSSKAKSSKSSKKDAKKSSKKSKSVKKSSKSKSVKKSSKTKKVVVHRRDRVVVRTGGSVAVPLVVIGASSAYAAYGPGWCRALHKGRHWAPRVGWHAGQHVGRIRC